MTSAADDGEEKYTLDYFTPGEGAPEEPPFKYRTFYLDDALDNPGTVEHVRRFAAAGEEARFAPELPLKPPEDRCPSLYFSSGIAGVDHPAWISLRGLPRLPPISPEPGPNCACRAPNSKLDSPVRTGMWWWREQNRQGGWRIS